MPTGEIWHLDTLSIPGLELDDIVKYATEMQREWDVDRWYVDQAYPAYIKTLKRKGLKIPKFTKVVEDGIAAVQGKIVDSNNTRRMFIINTPNNKEVIDAYGEYRWKIDGKGDIIEGKPYHDNDGISDKMDSIRYPFQCLFTKGGKITFTSTGENNSAVKEAMKNAEGTAEIVRQVNRSIMQEKIGTLATKDKTGIKIKKKGRIFWG
jgi:hypothetical protein